MQDVLNLITKPAKFIRGGMELMDLVIGREAPSRQLPNEDAYFQRACDFPDIFGVSYRSTLN
jgi:hypothetical protein